MGEIYCKVVKIYVWVGLFVDDSDEVMEWVDLIGGSINVDWGDEMMKIMDLLEKIKYVFMVDVLVFYEFEWFWLLLNLCYFINREYFIRLWVWQEVKLLQNKVFVCGFKQFDWYFFVIFVCWMVVKFYICVDKYGVWIQEMEKKYKVGSELVFNICVKLYDGVFLFFDWFWFDNSKLNWKDFRDVIYVNLGLFLFEYCQLGIKLDYDKNLVVIFIDVVVCVVIKFWSLGFFEFYDCFVIELDGFFSWVFDWLLFMRMVVNLENIWSVFVWILVQVEYVGDGVLMVNGVLILEV